MAISYSFLSFDIPESTFTTVNAIDNFGAIAGQKTQNGPATGFSIDRNGETRFFDPPGSRATAVWDINDGGIIVGYSFRDEEFLVAEPYIYDGSQFFTPDLFPSDSFPDVEFSSINNAGQIVGFYFTDFFFNPFDVRGFLLDSDDFENLGPADVTPIALPGVSEATNIFPWGINDAGKITGQFSDSEGTHGFILEENQVFQLDVPGAQRTRPSAINNSDDLIGVFEMEETSHSFIWSDGQFLEIAFPSALSTRVLDLNDVGTIVGRYEDASEEFHGFIGTKTADIAIFDGAINLNDGTTTTGIDLGRTQVGDEAIATFTIENRGDDDLMLTELKLPEGFSAVGEFVEDITLAPGDTTELQIQLDAETGGNFSGTLQLFAADSSDEQFLVTSAISGTARETVRLLGTMGDDRGDEAMVLPPSPNDYIAFGGEGNDLISAVAANSIEVDRLIGGPGNDELIAGTNDRLIGGSGGDRLDARNGGGGNSLLGGDGNDRLLSGVGDRLLGQAGNDILFAFGNSTLSGGAGADQFWLTADLLRNGAPTITDFQLGTDSIGFGGLKIDGAIVSLSDLSFTDTSSGVSVSILALSEDPLAIVRGVTADMLDSSSNFRFV